MKFVVMSGFRLGDFGSQDRGIRSLRFAFTRTIISAVTPRTSAIVRGTVRVEAALMRTAFAFLSWISVFAAINALIAMVVMSVSMVVSAVLIFLVQVLDFGDFSFALIGSIFSAFAPWTTAFTRGTWKAASIPTTLALVRRDSVFTTFPTCGTSVIVLLSEARVHTLGDFKFTIVGISLTIRSANWLEKLRAWARACWLGWLRGFCGLRHPLGGFRRLDIDRGYWFLGAAVRLGTELPIVTTEFRPFVFAVTVWASTVSVWSVSRIARAHRTHARKRRVAPRTASV